MTGCRDEMGLAMRVVGEAQLPFRVFVGDPVFRGLHSMASTADGRSYRDTAHVCYPWHVERPASERLTTLVLSTGWLAWHLIVHELGHVVDWVTGFSLTAEPVTAYAQTSRQEAFAEAFAAMLVPGYLPWDMAAESLRSDAETVSFLSALGFVPWWEAKDDRPSAVYA